MEKGSFQGTYIWKSFVHRKFDVYSMEYRVRADSQRCSKVVENVVSCFCLEAVPRDLLWCTLIPAVALFAIFCNPGLIEEFSHFQSCFGAIIYISLIWYLIMLCDTYRLAGIADNGTEGSADWDDLHRHLSSNWETTKKMDGAWWGGGTSLSMTEEPLVVSCKTCIRHNLPVAHIVW